MSKHLGVHTAPFVIKNIKDDNPSSLGFIPLNERSPIEQARWWDRVKHRKKNKMVELYRKRVDIKNPSW